MATYWNIQVDTFNDGRPGCSSGSAKPTLIEALTEACHIGSYYVLECGYTVTATLTETCDTCHGIGQKRCPSCHGKGQFNVIGPYPIEIHENAIARHTTI